MKDTLTVLREARARIARPNGWCKNALVDASGAVCVMGAVNCAAYGRADYDHPAFDVPHLALFKACGLRGGVGLIEFNNAPDTTRGDILALFDRAIAAEEAKLPASGTQDSVEVVPQATPRRRDNQGCERVEVPA